MDIDGTLMGADGRIPDSAVSACRAARQRGHLLYLCSGRPRSIISGRVLAVGFDGVISSGGAHIETGDTTVVPYHGTVIFDQVIPAVLVGRIAQYLEEHDCGYSLEKNDAIISNRAFLRFWENLSQRFSGAPQGDMQKDLISRISQNLLPENHGEAWYRGVNKVLFVESGDIRFAALEGVFGRECEIFHGSIPFSGNEGGEIGPPGVHKGSALERIAQYYGAALEDTIAFGDSDNDRRMIERAGAGIAMGNADPALKAIADDITADLADDGISKGFQKYGLI